jgi:hypothetical protein
MDCHWAAHVVTAGGERPLGLIPLLCFEEKGKRDMLRVDGVTVKSTTGTTVAGNFTMAGTQGFDNFCFFTGTVRPQTIKGKILGSFADKSKNGKFKIIYTKSSSGMSIKGTIKVNHSRYPIDADLDYDVPTGKFSTPGDQGLLRNGLV